MPSLCLTAVIHCCHTLLCLTALCLTAVPHCCYTLPSLCSATGKNPESDRRGASLVQQLSNLAGATLVEQTKAAVQLVRSPETAVQPLHRVALLSLALVALVVMINGIQDLKINYHADSQILSHADE